MEWFQGGQFLSRRRWDLGEGPTNRNSAGVGLGNQWLMMCDIKCDNPSISLQSPCLQIYLQISSDYWGLRAWVSPALPREKIRVSILARCQILRVARKYRGLGSQMTKMMKKTAAGFRHFGGPTES